MIVSLERSGGFTGRRVRSSIETGELTAEHMDEALRALDELASAPQPAPSAGSSEPLYRLTIHRPSGPLVIQLAESQVPAALRPLLTELVRRARPES